MQQTMPSRFGVISVISTVVVLILILGLAILSFLVEPNPPVLAPVTTNTISGVDPAQIDAALAIALLAGVSAEDMIEQSIIKSRPGTALATIVSSPSLSSREIAGDLLLLGEGFLDQDNKAYAAYSFKQASVVAVLSPDFSDTLRADVFLQAGIGLTASDQPILAKIYLDQAFLLATDSMHLPVAYRISVLEALNKAYLDLGLKDEARRCLRLSIDPPNLAVLPEQALILPPIRQIALPALVQEAEARRWQAAQFAARELVELSGAIRPDTVERLRVALLEEDAAKSQYFAEALTTEAQWLGKIDIIQAQINWQSLKHRVAKQGFGLSLVPEWEAGLEQIQADLAINYQALYQFYDEVIIAMPDASNIDLANEEVIRRQVLAGELGHYPNYPVTELRQSLFDASGRLIETEANTEMRVGYVSVDNTDHYILIRAEDVVRQ